jgi:hypothetical protein
MNRILFVVRTLVVSILAFLLLSPIFRQVNNYTEKPVVVIALDNSASISAVYDSVELEALKGRILDMQERLDDEQYEVELRLLTETEDVEFTASQTNLDGLLQNIRDDYEGRNLQEVYLISDGIYNEGISPTYRDYPFSISSVGIGDTSVKKDIYLTNLLYNKIAYQGNKFPLVASLGHHGYAGESVTVSVFRKGRVMEQKTITLPEDGVPTDINFLLQADDIGFQQYSVQAEVLEGEFSSENNLRQAFIEIVEGKQQIDIIAASPHPDLKAIMSALETSENYEINQYILSIPEERQALLASTNDADLVILHQLPSTTVGGINWEERLREKSLWYIYGPMMDLGSFSAMHPWITIRPMPSEYDRATAVLNPQFSPFTYSDELMNMLPRFPPLIAPFGEMSVDEGVETLLFQQIGSIKTTRPLLTIRASEGNKTGILIGSGLWQWKLTDYAENKNNQVFNEFVTKLIQFLSTRDNRSRFRLYPVQSEYPLGEDVVFETEVYNELYERVYGNKITLELTAPDGQVNTYSYVTSQSNSRYRISGLEQGIYQYKGTTEIDGRPETVTGQVVIRAIDLEMINLTANYGILQNLATATGGTFYSQENWEDVLNGLGEKEARGIIHSEETSLPAIDLAWIFLLLLILISTEWGLRKYHGAY